MSTQALPARLFRRQFAAVMFVLFDIAALAWLMYLSGGVGSGLGVVILVAVAAGSVLVTGRVSAFSPRSRPSWCSTKSSTSR